jgi:hypothetical protein
MSGWRGYIETVCIAEGASDAGGHSESPFETLGLTVAPALLSRADEVIE